MKKLLAVILAALFVTAAYGQNAGTVTNHAYAIGKGAGVTGYTSLLCASGQLAIGSATDPVCRTMTGDATLSAAGALALATVNANVGTFGSPTSCVTVTNNAKGLTTAISAATCAPAIGSITGLGTGVAPWLVTPNSANLRTALTDGTGTGPAVFGTAPNITAPTGIVKGDVGLGNVVNVDTTNAANISSGILPNARLAVTWSAYTPTISCGSGTITTLGTVTGAFYDVGALRYVEMVIPITTNGTCALAVVASLPSTPASVNTIITGVEQLSSGSLLSSKLAGSNINIVNYNNTYPGGTGTKIVMDGWYRTN